MRENTEDLYSGLEHEVVPGVVESLKVISHAHRAGSPCLPSTTRGGTVATSVTAVHKANIMKLGDGLFLKCVRAVARENADIPYDERIVDAVCMQLVMNPQQFDLLVLPNLYGDIVSDLCAGLVGGLGVVPGANLGEDIAVFEAVHGSAPDIAGQNLANPTALLLSALMMLRHIDEHDAAGSDHGGAQPGARDRRGPHARPRRHRDNHRVHGRGVQGDGRDHRGVDRSPVIVRSNSDCVVPTSVRRELRALEPCW